MAELATIARPYAEALFSASRAASPPAAAAPWGEAIASLGALVAQPPVSQALSNPGLSDQQRFELLAGLHGTALAPQVTELLHLMIENGRLTALPEVAAQYRALRNTQEGVADCVIESAYALKPEELTALVAALARKFPFRLQAEVRINTQLIGGVRVTVGDRVIDGSVRARLEAMQARLVA
jgi:F-type H+-transporting ATPase subunit delta